MSSCVTYVSTAVRKRLEEENTIWKGLTNEGVKRSLRDTGIVSVDVNDDRNGLSGVLSKMNVGNAS